MGDEQPLPVRLVQGRMAGAAQLPQNFPNLGGGRRQRMAAKVQVAQQIGLTRRRQGQQARDGYGFAAAVGKVNVSQLRQQFGAFLQVFRRARQRRRRVGKVRRERRQDLLA